MQYIQKGEAVSPEEIAEKLAELNAVHAVCEQRCTRGCDEQVRASYMPLRIWFAQRGISIVLNQGQYVIEEARVHAEEGNNDAQSAVLTPQIWR